MVQSELSSEQAETGVHSIFMLSWQGVAQVLRPDTTAVPYRFTGNSRGDR
jgi:hypothetical protein